MFVHGSPLHICSLAMHHYKFWLQSRTAIICNKTHIRIIYNNGDELVELLNSEAIFMRRFLRAHSLAFFEERSLESLFSKSSKRGKALQRQRASIYRYEKARSRKDNTICRDRKYVILMYIKSRF